MKYMEDPQEHVFFLCASLDVPLWLIVACHHHLRGILGRGEV